MSRIDDLAKDFLAQQRIAVASVSRDPRRRGQPHLSHAAQTGLYGLRHQPGPRHVPGRSLLSRRHLAPRDSGRPGDRHQAGRGRGPRAPVHRGRVSRVWMHCMLGTHPRFLKGVAASMGSVSPEAVRLCRENGIFVIPGSCPMQFLGEDFGHTCMRGFLRVTGALDVPASAAA